MNKACNLKIGWNLHEGKSELWSSVLWGKYNCNGNKEEICMKNIYSNLWKNIVKLWPKINESCFWSIGDGKSVDA